MKIIALCGTSKGCGKTTVGSFFAEQLPETAAVKITPKHKVSLGTDEFVREPKFLVQTENFTVVNDPEALLGKGTDTRRYWDAGADPVFWLRARDEGVVEGIEAICQTLAGDPPILIVEGSRYLLNGGHADLALLVYPNKDDKFAPTTFAAAKHVDAIVVVKNRPGPVELPVFDHDEFPAEQIDLPVFTFNLDENNLAWDDRYAMMTWLTGKLDLQTVTASDAECAV